LGKSYLGSGALRTHPTGNYWFSVRYSCFYLADWKWFRYSHTSYFFFCMIRFNKETGFLLLFYYQFQDFSKKPGF